MKPLQQQAPLFACPLCRRTLAAGDTFLRCSAGHTFSLSKKGYGDFAPAARPGAYDAALFESRARFIAGGFYGPLLTALQAQLAAYAPDGPLLDAGCGEGSFLKALVPVPSARLSLGIDLSRPGIQQAARGGGGWLWAVGDLSRLPLQDGSFAAVVNILSPANYPEFARVLRPGGVLLKVVPGDRYLEELRSLAAPHLRRRQYSSRQVQELFAHRFTLLGTFPLRACFPLSPAQAADLVAMTPLTQGIQKGQLPIAALTQITIDLILLVGRPR